MKKLICVICAVLILACAVSLTACSNANALDGIYMLVGMTSGGEDMSSYLSMIGDVTLTIKGDKATIEINGETTELTVDAKNMTFTGETGEPAPFTVEGDTLTMGGSESNSKMVFKKQTATADSK